MRYELHNTYRILKYARILILIGFLFKNVTSYSSVKNLTLEHQETTGKNSLLYEANCNYGDKNYTLALSYYKKILSSFSKEIKEETHSDITYKIGCCFFNLGRYNEAIPYLEESYSYFAVNGTKRLIIEVLTKLAVSFNFNNNGEDAFPFYIKLLELTTDDNEFDINTADVNYYISDIYKESGNYEEAILCINKALDIYIRLNDKDRIIDALGKIGACYLGKAEYDKAISFYQKSKNIAVKIKSKNLAFQLNGLALAYERKGVIDSAYYYHYLCRQNAVILDNKSHIMNSYNNTGNFYLNIDSYNAAENELNIALLYSDSLKNKNLSAIISKSLGKLYEKKKNYKGALDFYKRSFEMEDALNDAKNREAYSKLEIKFKTSEKQKEIVQLQAVNELHLANLEKEKVKRFYSWIAILVITPLLLSIVYIRVKAKQKVLILRQETLHQQELIHTERKERKRIAQDLHDSLGQMVSLAKMKASDIDVIESNATKMTSLLYILNQTYDELRKISHNIMPETLSKDGIVSAINELTGEINDRTSLYISLETSIKNNDLDEVQSITLYRIIQEIIANALKHANANLMSISIERIKDKIQVLIKDNGKGFNPVELKNSNGMGWKNIKARLSILKGTIRIKSNQNDGTIITLQF